MSELSERIRRNTHDNLDGWVQRLLIEAANELERLTGKLDEIKESGTAYMRAVDAMLAQAERDGLLKGKSPYTHAKATSDAVKHVFGTVN